ncbi:uncharacterized protein DEA37_0004862 [Paragonimus westermani]|uniref:Uncharacterized protein n=1 Tax=Paragonimus westermani TaxID=34504 RepID=A0A5J4N871_9TREM|nr:uncharacterized protein DEA37_0004862 [Paragonimus westermani]
MCLGSGHCIYDCRIQSKCGVENCGVGHHRLLHSVRHLTSESTEGAARTNCESTRTAQRGVIMGVIPVRVFDPTEDVLTYAFLDIDSDTTVMNQELTDRLNLTGDPSEVRTTIIIDSQLIPGRTVALKIHSLDGVVKVAVGSEYSVPSLRMTPQVDGIRNEICEWPPLEGVHSGEIPDKRASILIGNAVPDAFCVLDQKLGGRK